MRELERDFPTPTSARADRRDQALPPLVIVGAGRVGGSLARAAQASGLEATLADRAHLAAARESAEAAVLCVPDAAIPDAAAALAESVPPLRFVGHTSGATQLTVLDPVRGRGASTFSLHPLQTIPDAATDLTAAPCAIAGSDAEAEDFATVLAERLGMRPFAVPEEHRAAYHAAASVASNFLVALEESAVDLLAAAGIEDGRDLLAPLVLRTAANWAERGGDALTGPIARGDTATVERHLEAVRELDPELEALYVALAERTRRVARAGSGDER
jgi:predicted short-subunit dehydrogenase-like oxidoreductase (DUF2520 family)